MALAAMVGIAVHLLLIHGLVISLELVTVRCFIAHTHKWKSGGHRSARHGVDFYEL